MSIEPPSGPPPPAMVSTDPSSGPPAPAETTSTSRKRKGASPAEPIGDNELISLLLETPSGFAIFVMHGRHFNDKDATENIWAHFGEEYRAKKVVWLKEFQAFKDKSSAINKDAGVNGELTDMIMRCCHLERRLAVGNREYERIIEESLPVRCLFNDKVMEVMWGLKNLMHVLVPGEKLKPTKEELLPMSNGLKWLLVRYGFDVKPEMVTEAMIMLACVLHDSDVCENNHSTRLYQGGALLQDISGIACQNWDLMKLATALKIICNPSGTKLAEKELFTGDELSVLMDTHKYKDHILPAKDIYLQIHKRMVMVCDLRSRAQKIMAAFVADAQRLYESERALEAKRYDHQSLAHHLTEQQPLKLV